MQTLTLDWSVLKDWSLEQFGELITDYGSPLSAFNMQAGNHLVLKVPESRMTLGTGGAPIALPDTARAKTVGNLNVIKAFVIRVSDPWVTRHAEKYYSREWDIEKGQFKPKLEYNIKTGSRVKSLLTPGDAILYNSFNMGTFRVSGVSQRIAIVREIDVMARFPRSEMDRVNVGDHAVERARAG